jgi:hypothetical protein
MKRNYKRDEIHEVKQEGIQETKGNFTLYETKRNKILLVFCFTKQVKFHETTFVFFETKKEAKLETLPMHMLKKLDGATVQHWEIKKTLERC